MKKHTCAIEFLTIFIVFVLPPLITPSAALITPRKPVYPLQTFLYAACMTAVLYAHKKQRAISSNVPQKEATPSRMPRIFIHIGSSLTAFGALCLSAAVLQLLAFLFHLPQVTQVVLSPESVLQWINCILGTVCAAFFEEAVFRRYLPDTIKYLLPETRLKETVCMLSEALCIVLFALSHRAAGSLSVINAFVAGIILRVCTIQTGRIFSAWISHSVYNLLVLLISFSR